MNQPVRRKTDADATETNQLDVTGIFCGKLLRCLVSDTTEHHQAKEACMITGLFALSTVKLHGGMAALRGLRRVVTAGSSARHASIAPA
jgi:hypothetical protein